MLISVIFLAVLHTCYSHVVLTYPPARQYALDFLDNARTRPPCGVPRGYGPETEFKAGSTVTVTWHIAFPHQGGFYLEILDSSDQPIMRYEQSGQVIPKAGPKAEGTPEPEGTSEPEPETTAVPEHSAEPETTAEPGHSAEPEPESGNSTSETVEFIGYNDTTTLKYTITLPDMECENCTLRLIRQALEWGRCSSPYLFWSCADINIVKDTTMDNRAKCSGNGQWQDDHCFCDPMYEGKYCQYKDDCESIEHCNNHGVCENTGATSYPKRQCYCDLGWFGKKCEKRSSVQSRVINYHMYEKRQLSTDFMLYYRELKVEEELEVVMKVKTNTWVGLGWKPTDFRSGCQLFPLLSGVTLNPNAEPESTSEPETHGEPETTSEPETHGEPETTSEPKTTSEPETHGEPETTSEPETHGEPETTSEPETHGEPESEPGFPSGQPPCNGRPAPIGVAEPGAEPEAEPNAESEPTTTAEPKSEPTAEPKAESTPEPEGEAEAEPEGEPSAGGGTGYPSGTIQGDKQGRGTHGMDCTDMVIGSARGERSRIGDYYTRDRSTPQHDEFYGGGNSLTAALGFEENGYTVILFRKKLRASERSDYDIDAAPMTVIWAQGQTEGKYVHQFHSGLDVGRASDAMFYREDELKYHGHRPNRGTATINFRERSPPPSGCSGASPAECPDCAYQALWVTDTANDMVNFTIRARLGGQRKWVGLGFSPEGRMANSDAVIGWVDGQNVYVSDRYITGYSPPGVDQTENLMAKSGSLVNGVTEIKFSRKRSTGDSDNDFTFTDTDCPYLLFAVGGGYDTVSRSITQHSSTPQVSAERVCFTTTCATQGRKTITTYVSLRFPMTDFIPEYANKKSQQYAALTSKLDQWINAKKPHSIKEIRVVNLKKGSVVADFRVSSERSDDSVESVNAHRADVTDFFNSVKGHGQVDDLEVDPAYSLNQRDMEDKYMDGHSMGLTLVEKIVIGVSVAFCVIGLIVCVCKIREMRSAKSSSLVKEKYVIDDNGVYQNSLQKRPETVQKVYGDPEKMIRV